MNELGENSESLQRLRDVNEQVPSSARQRLRAKHDETLLDSTDSFPSCLLSSLWVCSSDKVEQINFHRSATRQFNLSRVRVPFSGSETQIQRDDKKPRLQTVLVVTTSQTEHPDESF